MDILQICLNHDLIPFISYIQSLVCVSKAMFNFLEEIKFRDFKHEYSTRGFCLGVDIYCDWGFDVVRIDEKKTQFKISNFQRLRAIQKFLEKIDKQYRKTEKYAYCEHGKLNDRCKECDGYVMLYEIDISNLDFADCLEVACKIKKKTEKNGVLKLSARIVLVYECGRDDLRFVELHSNPVDLVIDRNNLTIRSLCGSKIIPVFDNFKSNGMMLSIRDVMLNFRE